TLFAHRLHGPLLSFPTRRSSDLVWLGGGALAIVVLVTLGWFVLIGPERSQAGQLRDEAATARISAASMRARLAEARRQNGNLNRSEEHTSELQSQSKLVCRLLLE